MTGGFSTMPKLADDPATQKEIDEVIDAYATAAVSAKELGFDGVELHGGHGYFLDQFSWSETNLRTDRYGGSTAQRTRLAVEIVQEIKRRAGGAFPVVLRFSQFKLQDFMAKPFAAPSDLEAFLDPFVDAGVDAFHASQRRFWEGEFGSDLNLAGWARKLSGKPAITVGSVTLKRDMMESMAGPGSDTSDNLPLLCEMMARNEFDFVAVGRAMIANPNWPQRVRSGEAMTAFDAKTLGKLD